MSRFTFRISYRINAALVWFLFAYRYVVLAEREPLATQSQGHSRRLDQLVSTSNGQLCLVADIDPKVNDGPESYGLTTFNDKIYFGGKLPGTDQTALWSLDPDNGILKVESDVIQKPYYLTIFQNKLYFFARDEAHGYELWSFDGTHAKLEADIYPGPDGSVAPPSYDGVGIVEFDNKIYFSANDGVHGEELWSFDGTTASMVADIMPGLESSSPLGMTVYNNQLFFGAITKLFTNGVIQSTSVFSYDGSLLHLVVEYTYAESRHPPYSMAMLGNKLYYNEFGLAYYDFDTGDDSVILVPDVFSDPVDLHLFQDKIYFSAERFYPVVKREIFSFDGTTSTQITSAGRPDRRWTFF